MKITCEYCNGYLQDTDEKCPNCGATNPNLHRSADGVPKTILELKTFAEEKNLPLSQMRFFVGIDIDEPRAYGIYKDEEGNFIVYKNKANGKRVVRYKGKDEAYAVNEIYQKLRTEFVEQKEHQIQSNRRIKPYRPTGSTSGKAYETVSNRPNRHNRPNRTNRPSRLNRANRSNTSRVPSSNNKNKSSNSWVVMIIVVVFIFIMIGQLVIGGVYSFVSSNFSSNNYDGGNWDSYYYYDSDWNDNYEEDYDYSDDDDWNYDYDDDYNYDYDDDDYSWGSDWNDDWDDDDWDYDFDWNDSYSDWDSDW